MWVYCRACGKAIDKGKMVCVCVCVCVLGALVCECVWVCGCAVVKLKLQWGVFGILAADWSATSSSPCLVDVRSLAMAGIASFVLLSKASAAHRAADAVLNDTDEPNCGHLQGWNHAILKELYVCTT